LTQAVNDLERRLSSSKTYILEDTGSWKKFWYDRTIISKRSVLKFHKNSKETFVIKENYLTELDAFMWGFILGSKRTHIKDSWLSVNKEALPQIKKFCEYHETDYQCQKRKLRRKGMNKNRSKRYQVKYLVKLSPAVYQFYKNLGMNLKNASFPSFISHDLKIQVLKGYLNSQRCLISFKNHGFYPKIILRSKHLASRGNELTFLNEITQILTELGITTSTLTIKRNNSTWNDFYIYGYKNIKKLAHIFKLNSLKIQISLKLIELQKDLEFKKATSRLSELSMFILGLCHLHFQKSDEVRDSFVIEYTVVQENLLTSSNNMRKELYNLENFGFIRYFARGKKEFIKLSTNYKYRQPQSLKKEKELDPQETIFECDECGARFGYLDAWGEMGFSCPTCQSTHIINGNME